MPSEDALIVLVALGACALLAVGVAELLRRPRARQAEQPPFPASESDEIVVEPAVAPAPPVEPADAGEPPVPRAPRLRRTSALARHGLRPGHRPYARRAGQPPEAEPVSSVAVAESAPPPRPASLVEQCRDLGRAGRHADAIALATAGVQRAALSPPDEPGTTAALWSVIGHARHALGEHGEARAALERAIDAAAEPERAMYQRELAALAAAVARALAAAADTQPRADAAARLDALEQASAWADCASAAVTSDAELEALGAEVQARLWPAFERAVAAHVQLQEFRPARRLLRRALAHPRVPGEFVERLHELFSTTFSGEIGQLTAQAIQGVQDGREADTLAALQRVQSLLEQLSDRAISAERREEIGGRVAWAYRKLGERRLEAGAHEAALDPLLHALAHEVVIERQEEIHGLLVDAIEAVTEARTREARALAEQGDRDGAVARCESLATLLRATADRGLSLVHFAAAFTRVQRLADELRG